MLVGRDTVNSEKRKQCEACYGNADATANILNNNNKRAAW
jgi:hypothetical protein